MKKTNFSKILSSILCFALVAAIALCTAGCNDKTTNSGLLANKPTSSDTSSVNSVVLGQGATKFTVNITFSDGSEKIYTVNTDKKTVGEALQDVKLISGTVGDYGLMIETVDGETVKYADDGKYWAFYIDGAYAMSGVDTTEISEDTVYSFKVE